MVCIILLFFFLLNIFVYIFHIYKKLNDGFEHVVNAL